MTVFAISRRTANSYVHIAHAIEIGRQPICPGKLPGVERHVYCSRIIFMCGFPLSPLPQGYLQDGVSTVIYKFALGNGVRYATRGQVPGTVLNQFSMDEYEGYFRIATTRSGGGTAEQGNAVYILNAGMKQVSAIEDIAPGERIYSARFMGPRAYLVTFKQVDPCLSST